MAGGDFLPRLKSKVSIARKIWMKKLSPTASAQSMHGLGLLEAKYRPKNSVEILPFARNTPYTDIASHIIPDHDILSGRDVFNTIYVIETYHLSRFSLQSLLTKINEYFELQKQTIDLDVLSISGNISDNHQLHIVTLIRLYSDTFFFPDFYQFLGEEESTVDLENTITTGLNTEALRKIHYSPAELLDHAMQVKKQKETYQEKDNIPFLNKLDRYECEDLPEYDESRPLLYLLNNKEKDLNTVTSYMTFRNVFTEVMQYATSIELDGYYSTLRGEEKEEMFLQLLQDYVEKTYVMRRKTLAVEDVPFLMSKLERALFRLYIVQDLIDDPDVTDIKITDPESIRVRIHGRAYLSDISFINDMDYLRFVDALIIRNNIDATVPEQTFTDENDPSYILRFTITMPYISANNYPVLHIRKVSRKKLMAPDLIQAGMFDEKIRNYLLDCGKKSTGVIFTGPPGSGKTIALNWFLEEAYEDAAEILVIQENDELFAYRKGVIFQHVVLNPVDGQRPCTLEDLGQLALVAGANVFVIGEAKGGEVCSAITLSNSGCRIAMTVHSRSSVDAIDKMADLALRGYANSFTEAKRMMKSFQTIVFLKDFKIQEISEVVGFDEEKNDIIYKPIYRREENNKHDLCNE